MSAPTSVAILKMKSFHSWRNPKLDYRMRHKTWTSGQIADWSTPYSHPKIHSSSYKGYALAFTGLWGLIAPIPWKLAGMWMPSMSSNESRSETSGSTEWNESTRVHFAMLIFWWFSTPLSASYIKSSYWYWSVQLSKLTKGMTIDCTSLNSLDAKAWVFLCRTYHALNWDSIILQILYDIIMLRSIHGVYLLFRLISYSRLTRHLTNFH